MIARILPSGSSPRSVKFFLRKSGCAAMRAIFDAYVPHKVVMSAGVEVAFPEQTPFAAVGPAGSGPRPRSTLRADLAQAHPPQDHAPQGVVLRSLWPREPRFAFGALDPVP